MKSGLLYKNWILNNPSTKVHMRIALFMSFFAIALTNCNKDDSKNSRSGQISRKKSEIVVPVASLFDNCSELVSPEALALIQTVLSSKVFPIHAAENIEFLCIMTGEGLWGTSVGKGEIFYASSGFRKSMGVAEFSEEGKILTNLPVARNEGEMESLQRLVVQVMREYPLALDQKNLRNRLTGGVDIPSLFLFVRTANGAHSVAFHGTPKDDDPIWRIIFKIRALFPASTT